MRIRLAVAIAALAVFAASRTLPMHDGGSAQFAGRIDLPRTSKFSGGFSAIEVAPDGLRFFAVSDRGRILTGLIGRENTQLARLDLLPMTVLADVKGNRVPGKQSDAEGAAMARNRLYVSFEGDHRVLIYDSLDGPARRLPSHPDFARMNLNGGFEALAVDGQDRVYVLPERKWWRDGDWPVYRYGPDGWDRLPGYRQDKGFLPVGADFGPDDRLYILERKFGGLGFASRVTSYATDDSGLSDPRAVLTTALMRHGNLEGLSVWRGGQGEIRLTMVSDDNFLPFQRSQIVEYVLQNTLATQASRQ